MMVFTDDMILGMLIGSFLLCAGLTIGYLMGAATRVKPESKVELPMSARGDSKPEWAGSR